MRSCFGRLRVGLSYPLQLLLAVALTTLLGPICYRLIVQPLPRASVLVFLILTIGLHLALTGLGLAFWGPQPYSLPAFGSGGVDIGPAFLSYQAVWLLVISGSLMLLLYLFFSHSIYGKALRAAAVNRLRRAALRHQRGAGGEPQFYALRLPERGGGRADYAHHQDDL